MNILYEDKDIIVCIKEAGIPTQSDKSRDMDMVNLLRNYIASSELGYISMAGVPYVGLVHRLDRPVGGVMVFAKNPDALKELNRQITSKKFNKNYIAIGIIEDNIILDKLKKKNNNIKHVSEFDDKAHTPWINVVNYLYKDGRNNVSRIVHESCKNGKKAELDFRIIGTGQREINSKVVNTCLMEIYLITGRHHQIRVQMANQAFPLLGDLKYNKLFLENENMIVSSRYKNVALYSYMLEFVHPKTKKRMKFTSMPNQGWFGMDDCL